MYKQKAFVAVYGSSTPTRDHVRFCSFWVAFALGPQPEDKICRGTAVLYDKKSSYGNLQILLLHDIVCM